MGAPRQPFLVTAGSTRPALLCWAEELTPERRSSPVDRVSHDRPLYRVAIHVYRNTMYSWLCGVRLLGVDDAMAPPSLKGV